LNEISRTSPSPSGWRRVGSGGPTTDNGRRRTTPVRRHGKGPVKKPFCGSVKSPRGVWFPTRAGLCYTLTTPDRPHQRRTTPDRQHQRRTTPYAKAVCQQWCTQDLMGPLGVSLQHPPRLGTGGKVLRGKCSFLLFFWNTTPQAALVQ
jgi:hypothetical protein